MGASVMYSMELVQDKDTWKDLVNAAMNLHVI